MSFFVTVIKILVNIIFITSTDALLHNIWTLLDFGEDLSVAATNYSEQKIQSGGQWDRSVPQTRIKDKTQTTEHRQVDFPGSEENMTICQYISYDYSPYVCSIWQTSN